MKNIKYIIYLSLLILSACHQAKSVRVGTDGKTYVLISPSKHLRDNIYSVEKWKQLGDTNETYFYTPSLSLSNWFIRMNE